MAIPEKREDLVALGYVYSGDGKCRSCGAEMEWWITPKGKRMPMTVKEVKRDETKFFSGVIAFIRVPHWSDCPNAEDFRRAVR